MFCVSECINDINMLVVILVCKMLSLYSYHYKNTGQYLFLRTACESTKINCAKIESSQNKLYQNYVAASKNTDAKILHSPENILLFMVWVQSSVIFFFYFFKFPTWSNNVHLGLQVTNLKHWFTQVYCKRVSHLGSFKPKFSSPDPRDSEQEV